MSQRLNLFYAGYSVAAPSYYYKVLAFLKQHEGNTEFHPALSGFKTEILKQNDQHKSFLVTADELASNFNISIPDLPESNEEYFEWQKSYIDAFERKFPMSRIDYYYFFYGRKIAEIYANISLARTFIGYSFKLDGQINMRSRIDSCLKDTQFIIFKLIAAAALLSSEPRLNFFNVFYRQVSAEFEKFKSVDISEISNEELQKLSENLASYNGIVSEGYGKCITLLEEMGI
jgi:hypothetical protein